MGATSFEDLLVWQKAHAYVLDVYKMTEGFPKSELFGLTSQMRVPQSRFPQISLKVSRNGEPAIKFGS
jgi:hypothetical protein